MNTREMAQEVRLTNWAGILRDWRDSLYNGRGFSFCNKNNVFIEPCCDIGKSLLAISIFPFFECTPYAHPHISVCRVHSVKHLYAPKSGLFLYTLQTAENKKRQKALLPRPSDGYRVQDKNVSIVSILTFLYGTDIIY